VPVRVAYQLWKLIISLATVSGSRNSASLARHGASADSAGETLSVSREGSVFAEGVSCLSSVERSTFSDQRTVKGWCCACFVGEEGRSTLQNRLLQRIKTLPKGRNKKRTSVQTRSNTVLLEQMYWTVVDRTLIIYKPLNRLLRYLNDILSSNATFAKVSLCFVEKYSTSSPLSSKKKDMTSTSSRKVSSRMLQLLFMGLIAKYNVYQPPATRWCAFLCQIMGL